MTPEDRLADAIDHPDPPAPAEIRAIREGLGLSQTRFAALIGAANATNVSQWERGETRPSAPFARAIRAIARGESPLVSLPPGFAVVRSDLAKPVAWLTVGRTELRLNRAAQALLRGKTHILVAVSPERQQMILAPCPPETVDAFRVPKEGTMASQAVRRAVLACGAAVGTRYPVSVVAGHVTVDFRNPAQATNE